MYRSVSQTLITGALLMTGTAVMAESALRVYCEGAAEGSKIYVNGQFKAECPSDIFIPAGDIKLRVVKAVDSEYERVFEKSFYLADNSAKKIKVHLSGPQLSEAAIKARELKEQEIARAALERAKKGNINAMREVAAYYEQGKGVLKSSENANYWKKQAIAADQHALAMQTLEEAKTGNVEAMFEMANFYEKGKGVKADAKEAALWKKKYYDIKAEIALSAARDGDIEAMREISEYYAEGKGVEKNLTESAMWAQKADKVEAADAEKARQDRINRDAQAELDEINFFERTQKAAVYMQFGWDNELKMNTPFTATTTLVPWAIVSDLITAPTKSAQVALIKRRMASRPATYGKPDSMIAQAYREKLLAQH